MAKQAWVEEKPTTLESNNYIVTEVVSKPKMTIVFTNQEGSNQADIERILDYGIQVSSKDIVEVTMEYVQTVTTRRK